MKLAEAEIGSDLGTLPEPTKRRVLVEFLIENQLFADAAEGQKLGSGRRASTSARSIGGGARCATPTSTRPSGDLSTRPKPGSSTQRRSARPKPEEEVRARHILVESKDKARELFEKIAHGSDFARLAREHSKDPGSKDQGGELGFFTRGQMVPQFEEAAFKLKKGEVGEPFESQFGWHIVRVDDRAPARRAALRGGQGARSWRT